jgi:thiamine pyrophosphokinase
MSSALLVLNGVKDPATAERLERIHGMIPRLNMGDGFPLSMPLRTIGVDGGANLLRAAKLHADLIIGDLDSVKPETLDWYSKRQTEIVKDEDQNRNDLEKALDWMGRHEIGSGIVACFEGDRLDMIAGLHALLVHRSRPRLLLAGESQLAERIDPGFHELRLQPGSMFSLVSPVEAAEVDLQGASWELSRHRLLPGCGGVSNLVQDETIHVSSSHPLILFRPAPWAGSPLDGQ